MLRRYGGLQSGLPQGGLQLPRQLAMQRTLVCGLDKLTSCAQFALLTATRLHGGVRPSSLCRPIATEREERLAH